MSTTAVWYIKILYGTTEEKMHDTIGILTEKMH